MNLFSNCLLINTKYFKKNNFAASEFLHMCNNLKAWVN